ncbi:cytochrome C biogenesis protein CcdA [Siminovitchia terrae]|uniref:Cytochrome C biogenesis protein CcdA n=1 Tax=Siminovitchia terrae TaxID=1914933 RepID=A0A429X591_SIMTE|nr:cytochrome c biogenesis protein CcdA [Siminovitchia terrae]RST58544.1 cytochrome c biogenesis protein CcdA [Siminovitchia terrae]GIN89184.1 cytochrome C biogenesis protein CcdA [Siminovitchia terrae]GIN95249.1 cytochrome C biogenesis protein CcdA [Siminovitchia terrae]
MQQINIFLAFGAGFLSFISPCTLPLYPAFLSYITGMTVNEMKEERGIFRKKAFIHTILFLVGFSIIFLALGLSSTLFEDMFRQYQALLRQVGAIVLVFFGLVLTGILSFNFLNMEKKIQFQNRPTGYLGSVLIGIAFAAGWTPCTGPILGAMIGLVAGDPGKGLLYMGAYVLGFSVPFLLMSLFLDKMTFLKKNGQRFMKIGGYLMIIIGILLFFDWMQLIISILQPLFGDFKGF